MIQRRLEEARERSGVRSQDVSEPCKNLSASFLDHSMASFYQEYLDALRSPDTSARRDAAVALSVLGPGVLPYLIDLLKGISGFYYEANDRYASDIARAIGLTLYPEIAVPRLIEVLMTSSEPLVRKETAYALRIIGRPAIDAVPAIVGLLNDNEDPGTRRDAAIALGTIGKSSPAVIHRLTELLEAKDVQSQMGGARALGMLRCRLGRPARLALATASQSADAAVRIRAATTLAAIDKDKAAAWIPSLLSSLRSAEAAIRLESAFALQTVQPGPHDIDALVTSLRDDTDAFVRREVASVLGGIPDGGRTMVGHLATALRNDADVRVREAAGQALWSIGPSAITALPALIAALQDADAAVREFAALALRDLGPSASAAADALRAALHDRNPAVQIRAAIALVSVAPDDSTSVNHLVYLVGSNYPEVRLVAAAMLGQMRKVGAATAMPVLEAMMEETDPWVRAEARRTIQALNGRSIPLLTRMFPPGDQNTFGGTTNEAQTVGRDAAQRLLKALDRARTRGNAGAVLVTLGAIQELGVAAKQAVPVLEELVLDPRPDVRFQAVMALQAIDDTTYSGLCVDHCRNWSDIWRRHSQPIDKSAAGHTVSKEASKFTPDQAQLLDALLATVPKEATYDELATHLEGLIGDVRQRAAVRLLPALKEEMQRRPHETHDQKKELVKWTNAELRRFGLAIKSPKTGNAANFVTDKGNHPEEGRFQLRSEGEGSKVETFSTPKLLVLMDAIELIEAPPREEGLVNWADRAKGITPPTQRRR